MKKIMMLMAAVALMATPMSAKKISENKVPAEIVNEFNKRYPDARRECWTKDDNTAMYEVKFKDGNEKYIASYDPNGTWMETSMCVRKADLPQPVRNTLNDDFTGYKVRDPEMVMDSEVGTCYEMELKKGDEKWDVVITETGKVIEQTLVESEETLTGMVR